MKLASVSAAANKRREFIEIILSDWLLPILSLGGIFRSHEPKYPHTFSSYRFCVLKSTNSKKNKTNLTT